jgi:hypothetical protein
VSPKRKTKYTRDRERGHEEQVKRAFDDRGKTSPSADRPCEARIDSEHTANEIA